MKLAATIFIGSAILAAAGATGAAQALRVGRANFHTSPQSVTLTGSDVHSATGGTFRISGGIVTNAAVAAVENVSLPTMNRYRITGYQTSFARTASSGVILIIDSVGLYKSTLAAEWEYKLFTTENKPPAGSAAISMRGIGEQARGYAFSIGGISEASVYFRRGIYTARLDLTGRNVSMSAIATHLSRVLDGRMKAAA